MKRVLLLVKGLGRGGAEQILVSTTRHGDRSKYEYEVAFLLPWKTAFVPELEAADIRVHCLEGARGVSWVSRLRRLVDERDIDLLHVHSPYPAVGARLSVAGRPVVYTEHNVWQRYRSVTRWGNMLTYPLNDHVFAVSDHVRTSVTYPRALRFMKMPTLETLYHGPDRDAIAAATTSDGVREEFGIPDASPIVGTVANLKPQKGYEHLLEAAVQVREQVPETRFVLVGQGPLEGELHARAKRLGLDGSVVFTGFREDAVRIASAFDVLAMASLNEGLSIALVEAMSLGKPVVVTDVGGQPEVVQHGTHGFVVPPADPVALASSIVTLLKDPELRARFGSAARLRAMDFDMERAVQRMECVYEELLR